jgi:heme exporter protein B
MSKFTALLKYEYKNLYKTRHLHTNLFWMFLISGICLPMISEPAETCNFGPLLLIIYIPISLFGICSNILIQDQEDGSLDFALTTNGALNIVLGKFITITLTAILTLFVCLPFFMLFYSMNLYNLLTLFFCSSIISLQAAALCILIAAIEIYFTKSRAMISTMLLPLILPSIILSGVMIREPTLSLLFILTGIAVAIVPIIILSASYLIKHKW